MAYGTLANRQFAAPALSSVELTAPGGRWGTWGDWEVLEAEMDADSVLTGVTIRPTFLVFFPIGGTPPSVNAEELQIGVDEVPIASWPIQFLYSFNSIAADNGLFLPCPIGIDAIPEGSQLCARIRTGMRDVETYQVAGSYVKKPLVGSWLTTPNTQKTLPYDTGADEPLWPVLVTPGAPEYVDGAMTTIVSDANPFVLVGISLWGSYASVGVVEVDLFANGERIHRVKAAFNGKAGLPYYLPLRQPLSVPDGGLIEAVARTDYFSATPLYVALSVIETPL